jgi:phospholipase C
VQDKIDRLVVLMLENRSLDNVLGWHYATQSPQHFVGADTTPIYQGPRTGSYANNYKDRLIPVTRGTTGATGHASVPPQAEGPETPARSRCGCRGLIPARSTPTSTSSCSVHPPGRRRLIRRLAPAAMAGFAYDYDAFYETWEQLDQIMEAYRPAQPPGPKSIRVSGGTRRHVQLWRAHEANRALGRENRGHRVALSTSMGQR